jgi:hypothetical protein
MAIGKKEKELVYSLGPKDFRVDYFRASGPGGQARNKIESAVRITHMESGATGECTESRSQLENKRTAFERLLKHPKFKVWHNRKVWEFDQGKKLEEIVDEMMAPKNLKVEVKENNKWVAEKVER